MLIILLLGSAQILMLLTLAQALPNARRFFLSDRWGGYAKSSPAVDAIHNPVVMPLVLAIWTGAAAAVTVGWASPWAALLNLGRTRGSGTAARAGVSSIGLRVARSLPRAFPIVKLNFT